MKTAILCAFALTIFACSSTSGNTSTAGTGGAGGHTATTSSSSTSSSSGHMNSCVLTTDTGNSEGVGAYCTPGGNECAKFPLAGVCLADVGQSEWFCTRIGCTKDADCGAAATCVMQQGGAGCVPNKCLSGGTDGGTDSGSATDGGDGG